MNPKPQPLQDPRFLTQQNYFNSIQQHIAMMLQQVKGQPPKSKTDRIQEIIKEVSGALTTPNDNQADILQRIIENYDRLGLAGFRNNRQQYQQFILENPEAQGFINDLATFNRIQNRVPNAPQTISDPDSITPDTIEATMLNLTPQENSQPIFLPPDQHELATHIIDTIHDAHQQGQQYTMSDMSKLILNTPNISEETARSITHLSSMYLESMGQPVEPIGTPQTPADFTPQGVEQLAEFGGAEPDQIDIPNPAIGLGGLRGFGLAELDQMLGTQPASVFGLMPITNNHLQRIKGSLKSSGGGSAYGGSDDSGSTAIPPKYKSEGTAPPSFKTKDSSSGGGSGYYSGSRRDISATTSSSVEDRLEEAEQDPK